MDFRDLNVYNTELLLRASDYDTAYILMTIPHMCT